LKIEESLPGLDAGVVHQDVQLGKMLIDGSEHPVDVGCVSDIRLNNVCCAFYCSDLGGGSFRARCIGVVVDDDVASGTRELEGDSFADTFAGAGNQRGPFCE
jgi:hypothetical protein